MANAIIAPKIFAREVIRNRDRKNVFATHCNRAYEWELSKAWDSVRVQTLPTLNFTAQTITGAGDMNSALVGTWPGQDITATDFIISLENLIIDKYSEILVKITDHQAKQSNLTLTQSVAKRFTEAEGRLIDDQVRDQVLVTQIADIPTENIVGSVGSPIVLNATNVYAYFEELRVKLAEQNVTENLCAFVSPYVQSMLIQSKLLDNTDKWLMARYKGYIGVLGDVRIYMTNALTDSQAVIMMQEDAINLVVQLNDYDVRTPATGFYQNLLAQIVWGLKIFNENAKAIAVGYFDKV